MYSPKLSRRYAKSLYGLAKERGEEDTCLKDMEYIHQICVESPDFENMVESPIINPEKKEDIFNAILKGNVSELSLQFVLLMTRKGREKHLKNIAEAYVTIYNTDHRIKILSLTTATELSQTEIDKIVNKVKSQVDASELEVRHTINPDLIGGFVVQVEDKLFDASVKRDLNDINKQFHKNAYISNLR